MICFISQQPVRIERREEFGFHFKMFITAVKLKIKQIFWTNQVPNVTLSECGTWLIGFYQDVWSSLCNLLLTLKILWLQWSSLFFSLLFFLKSIPQKWRQSFVNRSVSLVWIMWMDKWMEKDAFSGRIYCTKCFNFTSLESCGGNRDAQMASSHTEPKD